MAQLYFKSYIKILSLLLFINLYATHEITNLQIGEENIHALVTVFHTLNKTLTDDFVYDFLCPGILIHRKAALVLSYCWSRPSQTLDAVVRSYDWMNIEKITRETPYEERSVTEILNFVPYGTQKNSASHLNIVVLAKSFSIGGSTEIIPYNSYSKRINPFRNECFTIHVEGNMTKGLTIKKFSIWPTELTTCCLNWQPSLLTANDYAKELDECVSKLNGLYCFEYVDSGFCQSLDSMGAPVFCQKDESPGKYYLRGFVADRKGCKFVVTNIEEQKWWIRNELNVLSNNNNYQLSNMYQMLAN